MTVSILANVLDEAESLVRMGRVSLVSFGAEILPGKTPHAQATRAREWIIKREPEPNGETALKLQNAVERIKAGMTRQELKSFCNALAELQRERRAKCR